MKKTNLSFTSLNFIFTTLVILLVSRLYLITDNFERVKSTADFAHILIQGMRVDFVLLGYFFTIPLILGVWISNNSFAGKVLKLWLVLSFTAIVFMEVVTPEFIAEYDLRPNRIFIDYLAYPGEVSSMLWEGYKHAIFLSLAALAVCIFWGVRISRKTNQAQTSTTLGKRLGLSLLILLVGFGLMRSSLQHRPFNPSMVYFSNDNLLNSLTLNSMYSVLFAAYNASSEKIASTFYGKMSDKNVIEGVRNGMLSKSFVSDEIPTLQYHKASYRGKPRNIVILLQESLGSRYIGSLGGEDLTPHIDQLMPSTWHFTNAYATGTRSVRGIEAVSTGFSPGPSRSVVKLSKSQANFFSIASLLKNNGYHTQFIYGGESHFDNMKSFFLGNGVDDIKDLNSFETKPGFVGSWGASDEDLFEEAHHQFELLSQQDQPFFSLVFSSSNHTPWEFPETCNGGMTEPLQTRENAIRYADCALGKFFDMAKHSNYWDNTLFLVIADHDSGASGTDLIPIDHFKIPALIIGKDIPPHRDDRLVSQIDFAPTLLSLAGVSDYHPMIGYDLTQTIPESQQRALIQFADNFAWMNNENITILQPNLPAKHFTHNGKQLLNELAAPDEQRLSFVRANALWSSLAYEKGLYKLPSQPIDALAKVQH